MNKFLIIFPIIAAVAAAGFFSSKVNAQGETSQGNPCGTTNGNGQIVRIENNEFILKRHDSGLNQIIHLTDQASIETSTGPATLSDLKTGDTVTLVGGPNQDGSFTAYAVVVCNGTQENGTNQETPTTVRNGNSEEYEKVSGGKDSNNTPCRINLARHIRISYA